jgi:hypothetical protein
MPNSNAFWRQLRPEMVRLRFSVTKLHCCKTNYSCGSRLTAKINAFSFSGSRKLRTLLLESRSKE